MEVKLNLGSGNFDLEGYINLDIKRGEHIYPLSYPPNHVDEIRCSHTLEHFPHGKVLDVLKEWYRVLKPGGIIKIAVPDFELIAKKYLNNEDVNVQGFISGGQEDENDYHKCVFDTGGLEKIMEEAGFYNIKTWKSDTNDCSSYDISLNLQGEKPNCNIVKDFSHIQACMSVPRLGFMDNFFCIAQSLLPLKIQIRKQTGVFWGQALTRAFKECMKEPNAKYILAIDYDTVFTKEDVVNLVSLAEKYDTDALACLQVGRGMGPLFTAKKEYAEITKDKNGKREALIPVELLQKEILPVDTMHFGLTLIKIESLLKLDKPWFHSDPGEDKEWGDDRTDDDIHFWKKWKEAGLQSYIATHIPVGHVEAMVLWPDETMKTIYQTTKEFWNNGKPINTWK